MLDGHGARIVEVNGRDVPAFLGVEAGMLFVAALFLRFGGIVAGVKKELPAISLELTRNMQVTVVKQKQSSRWKLTLSNQIVL
jgi:hypothetical protein